MKKEGIENFIFVVILNRIGTVRKLCNPDDNAGNASVTEKIITEIFK